MKKEIGFILLCGPLLIAGCYWGFVQGKDTGKSEYISSIADNIKIIECTGPGCFVQIPSYDRLLYTPCKENYSCYTSLTTEEEKAGWQTISDGYEEFKKSGATVVTDKPVDSDEYTQKEFGVYDAKLEEIEKDPSAYLALNMYVELPQGSCIYFNKTENGTAIKYYGCYSDREKPIPNIFEIGNKTKNIDVFGTSDNVPVCTDGKCLTYVTIDKVESGK